jgi:hypothetical protein
MSEKKDANLSKLEQLNVPRAFDTHGIETPHSKKDLREALLRAVTKYHARRPGNQHDRLDEEIAKDCDHYLLTDHPLWSTQDYEEIKALIEFELSQRDRVMPKMYILIPDDVPLGFAINAAAHASLACYLKFKDWRVVGEWLEKSFRKVTVKVTRKQFDDAKSLAHNCVMTESALGGREVALAFCPNDCWPSCFRTFQLYGKEKT